VDILLLLFIFGQVSQDKISEVELRLGTFGGLPKLLSIKAPFYIDVSNV
jgi:hypothetical protein